MVVCAAIQAGLRLSTDIGHWNALTQGIGAGEERNANAKWKEATNMRMRQEQTRMRQEEMRGKGHRKPIEQKTDDSMPPCESRQFACVLGGWGLLKQRHHSEHKTEGNVLHDENRHHYLKHNCLKPW